MRDRDRASGRPRRPDAARSGTLIEAPPSATNPHRPVAARSRWRAMPADTARARAGGRGARQAPALPPRAGRAIRREVAASAQPRRWPAVRRAHRHPVPLSRSDRGSAPPRFRRLHARRPAHPRRREPSCAARVLPPARKACLHIAAAWSPFPSTSACQARPVSVLGSSSSATAQDPCTSGSEACHSGHGHGHDHDLLRRSHDSGH